MTVSDIGMKANNCTAEACFETGQSPMPYLS